MSFFKTVLFSDYESNTDLEILETQKNENQCKVTHNPSTWGYCHYFGVFPHSLDNILCKRLENSRIILHSILLCFYS